MLWGIRVVRSREEKLRYERDYWREHRTEKREYDRERREHSNMLRRVGRERVVQEIGTSCSLCSKDMDTKIHLHHIVKMYHDGSNSHYNKFKDVVRPLCPRCHYMWHTVKWWLDLEVM
jgi:predicted HNH restriction endonuclease